MNICRSIALSAPLSAGWQDNTETLSRAQERVLLPRVVTYRKTQKSVQIRGAKPRRLIAARDQPPRAALRGTNSNVRATSARLPCSASKGDERQRVLRIAATRWCGPRRRSRVPATRERSAHKRTHASSASISCDDPRCGCFPQRLSSGAQEKDPRPLPCASDQLASLPFIRNLGSSTQPACASTA